MLTTREKQVASLIADGYIEKEIADRMRLAYGTVHTYKSRKYRDKPTNQYYEQHPKG